MEQKFIKPFFLILIALISISSFAQVSEVHYDSTTNELGKNYRLYIGQTLLPKPLSQVSKKYGYVNFHRGYDALPIKNNRYRCNADFKTPEDSIINERFLVIDAVKTCEFCSVSLILLSESKDTVTYTYSENDSDFLLEFVVEGYLIKETERLQNTCMVVKEYLIKDKSLVNLESPYWFCKNVELDRDYGGIVLSLQNAQGQKIKVSHDALFTFGKGFYYCDEYNKLIKKYGNRFADNLIYSKVELGMKKSLCAIILAAPSTKNKASSGSQSAEVWTIGGKYYYFTNNRLSSMNE